MKTKLVKQRENNLKTETKFIENEKRNILVDEAKTNYKKYINEYLNIFFLFATISNQRSFEERKKSLKNLKEIIKSLKIFKTF